MSRQMKTLTLGGKTYEIVDAKARADIANLDAMNRRDCVAPITQTASGNAIVISDSSNRPIRNLKMFGKSKQATATGKQLFNVNTTETLPTQATFTAHDEVITYSASEPYMVSRLRVSHGLLTPGKTYVLECDGISDGLFCQFIANNVASSQSIVDARLHGSVKRVEFAIPVSTDMSVFETFDQYTAYMAMSFFFTTETYNNRELSVTGLRLYAADNPLTVWEPFSGGIAGPNPDYPIEIDSVENPVISVHGGNIFNAYALTAGVNKTLDVFENGYVITAKGGSDKGYTSSTAELDVSLLRGKNVTIAADAVYSLNQNAKSGAQLNIKYPTWTEYIAISQSGLNKSVRIGDNAVSVHATVYTNNTASALTTDNTVTIYGMRVSVESDCGWCEYKERKTMTLPRTLSGISVIESEDYNYVDSDGKYWICDEIDFDRKVYVQRVANYVFDGSDDEAWSGIYNYGNKDIDYVNIHLLPANSMYSARLYCNRAVRDTWNVNSTCFVNEYDRFVVGGSYFADALTSISAFRAYLAENPITLVYPLGIPIETPLTDEELAAFNLLYTHETNTTVLNNQGAGMEVEYSRDIRDYIREVVYGDAYDLVDEVVTQDKIQLAVDNWLSANYPSAEGVSF